MSQFKMCKDIDFTEIMYKEIEGMEGTKGTKGTMRQNGNKPKTNPKTNSKMNRK